MVLKQDNIPMRPNFESVMGRVLDHLTDIAHKHPDQGLDIDRVGVAVITIGGYYARSSFPACVFGSTASGLWR